MNLTGTGAVVSAFMLTKIVGIHVLYSKTKVVYRMVEYHEGLFLLVSFDPWIFCALSMSCSHNAHALAPRK